jgi:DNA-binding transcriptional LysR family regulator
MATILEKTTGLVAFVRTVESGSFSAASRLVGSSQSAISKSVAALERRLGAKLIQRSTRTLSLTAEGQAYYERVAPLLRAIEDAEDLVQGAAAARGLIRVSAPQELGRMLIAPWAATFLDQYPEVRLELGISDRFVDIIREGFDIAVRMGSLDDSDLISRKIGDIRFVLAASPDYISRNNVPAGLEDLGRHVFVRYLTSGRSWPYILADGTQLPTSGRFVTDDSGSIRQAVLCGAGIAYLLHVTVAQDLDEGRLVELVPQLRLPTMPVFVVHAFGRQLPLRARLFVDSLAERIAELSS